MYIIAGTEEEEKSARGRRQVRKRERKTKRSNAFFSFFVVKQGILPSIRACVWLSVSFNCVISSVFQGGPAKRREGTRKGTREGAVGSLCDKEEGSTHFVHVFAQQAAPYATHKY